MFPRRVLPLMFLAACGQTDPLVRDGLDPPRCADCAIGLTPVIEIGFTAAPIVPSSGALVTLDANHERFIVVALPFRSEIHEFDVDGRYVRSAGQEGPGPDDYLYISAIEFDATDSLWVFDPGNGRADVFGPDLVRARSIPLSGAVDDVIALDDGTFALRGIATDSTGGISVARVLRRDGSTSVLLREAEGPSGLDPAGELGAIAKGRGRRDVWMAALHAWAIELRSAIGNVEQSFERSPAWFQIASATELDRYPDLDLRPALLDMAMDFTGRLWVIGGTVDRRLPSPERAREGILDVDEWVDTVIEVIDPASGALITSVRLDHAPPRFLRDGLVQRVLFDPNGLAWIDISRLEYSELGGGPSQAAAVTRY
jgi:hypothetical protein